MTELSASKFVDVLPSKLHQLHATTQIKLLLQFLRGLDFVWYDLDERRKRIAQAQSVIDPQAAADVADLKKLLTLVQGLDRVSSHQSFVSQLAPLERLYLRELCDHDLIIDSSDRVAVASDISRLPVTLVLENIRSAFNVGSIFRTAECVGIDEIVLLGYTATPENAKMATAALGSTNFVKWQRRTCFDEIMAEFKSRQLPLVAVETVTAAEDCFNFNFPWPCALLFGNERYGLEAPVVSACDAVVKIPVFGHKNSLNVALAAGVLLYELHRRWRA